MEGVVEKYGGKWECDRFGEERGVVLCVKYLGREDCELCGATGESTGYRLSAMGDAGFVGSVDGGSWTMA